MSHELAAKPGGRAGATAAPLRPTGKPEAMLIHGLKVIAQTFGLWLIYYFSTWAVGRLHLPLPGSVLGMIGLFALLATGIVKEQWLTAATTPLLRHLAFFFIPIAVELMNWGDLFLTKGHLLFLPLVVSLLVALLATGGIVQLLPKPAGKNPAP